MSGSRAVATTLPDGTPELERRWTPLQAPWAAVLLVHGLGEHSGRYERTGVLLAEAETVVESFDLIGFGASGGKRGDIDRWSRYLDQIGDHLASLRSLGIPVVLLGHSMGGLLSLDYVLSERPRPDLLVLSAPGLGGGKAWQRVVAPVLGKLVPGLRVPNVFTGDQLSRDPAVGEAYFADPLVITKTSARLGSQLFTAVTRTLGGLDRLDLPTLVLHGGADTLVPTRLSEPLASLPTVERRVLPGLRHEIFNEPEGPEVLAGAVAWIREHLTAPA